jgi:hypothetical protein
MAAMAAVDHDGSELLRRGAPEYKQWLAFMKK